MLKRFKTNPFKNKITKITLTISLIALGLIMVWRLLNPTDIEAAWFDDNYSYRQAITFTHNAALTDRRVTITVDTSTLISVGKMQSDCDDSRFTDNNGKILKYQLTGTCNNASTTYDVIFPTIINGSNAAYFYYGNTLAISNSTDVSSFTALSPSGGSAALATEEKGSTPVLYWSFNDATGTTAQDSSVQNNDGTLTNGPVWKTKDDCVLDGCIFFDGTNDRVGKTYSTDTELNPSTASITVSAWFRHSSAISGQDTLIARADGLNGVGYKIYMNLSGNICFGIDAVAGSFPNDAACTTTTYNDSNWHFMSAVKNTTTDINTYIDGKLLKTTASITTSSISGTSTPFYVGIDADTTSNPWDGYIDEVKAYNYAKTAAQIYTDYANRGSLDQTGATLGATDPTQTLSNGLIGYWKMDETSWTNDCSTTSVLDSSGNAKNGKSCPNSTGISTPSFGKFANAPSFNGTSQFVKVNTPSLPTTDFTYSAWVNPANITGAKYIFYGQNGSGSDSLGIYLSADDIRVDTNNVNRIAYTSIILANTWSHIVVTRNGSTIRLYLNGILYGTTGTDASALSFSTCPLLIGVADAGTCNSTTGGSGFFGGKIDEARVYNRALSANDVQKLYDWAPAPVAYWKMDEGSWTVDCSTASVIDSSTSGNNSKACPNSTGPVGGTIGKFGKAGSFDGTNDYILVPNSTSIESVKGTTNNAWTYSAWLYPNTLSTNAMFYVTGSATDNNGQDIAILLNYDGSATTLKIKSPKGPGVSVAITLSSGLSIGSWQYLSIARNGSTIIVYKNGVEVGRSTGYTQGSSQGTYDMTIGGSPTYSFEDSNSTTNYNGKIDDFKIYNYDRSAKQVIEDMNANHPIVGTPVGGPAGHWSFDEGYGTTANDKSLNTNSLTLSTATSAWTNSGKFGKAWHGLGTNWLSRADDDDFDFAAADDFTISTWFKSTSASNPGTTEYILDKSLSGATQNAGYAIYAKTSGVVCFGIDDDTTWTPDDEACSVLDIYDATWHHITAKKTGITRIDIYTDGKLIGSDTSIAATATLANSRILYIGDRDGVDNGNEFNGDIDETKIYRAALNDSEIKVEYNQGKAQVLGTLSTESDGTTASFSNAREYCIPGDSTSCAAPAAEWNFEEHSGTSVKDTSGNSITGTLTSGSYIQGKIGTGINFSGTTTVDFSASNTPDTRNAFTISGWIKPSSLASNLAIYCTDSSSCLYVTTTGALTFACAGTTASSSTSSVTAAAWNHVVMTYDGTSVYNFYINGQYLTSDNSASECNNSASNWKLGYNDGSATASAFSGVMDQFRIYTYERTAAQVAWDYNRGAPIARYNMDECTGTTIHDSTNTYNGTLTIGATGTYTSAGTCSSGTSTHSWNGGTTGKFNSATALDGTDDYISITDTANLRFDSAAQDYSHFAWVKRTTTGIEYIVSKEDADNDGWRMMFNSSNQVVCSEDISDVTSTTAISDTNWHQVGCTISRAGNGQIYIDGKADGSTVSMGSDAMATTSNIAIGTRSYTATNYFNGLIDEVQLYNYALTTQQIKTIYNQNAAIRFGP